MDKPQREQKFYRPELDALRFFAFFSVFVHHCLQNQSAALVLGSGNVLVRALALVEQAGNFGMSLFFVLSAYLITQLLLLEIERTRTVRVRAFYSRRVLRIWPLYFFFLALCVALSWIYPATFHVTGGRIAAFLLLSANWYLIAHTFAPFEMGILWSISVEEQFYLLWPAVVLLGRGRRGIAIANLFFASVSVATILYLGIPGADGLKVWLNSFVEFLFFAIGSQLALLTHDRLPRWPAMLRWLAFAGGIALWIASVAASHFMREPSVPVHSGLLLTGYLVSATGTVLIFVSVLGIEAANVPAWLRYLGKISYGLYVFHMLMLTAAIWLLAQGAHLLGLHGAQLTAAKILVPVAAFSLTLTAAAASYRWLESPFLRLRKRFTVVASRPI